MRKGVPRNSAKITGKHLCSCEFYEISRNTSFIEHFRTAASIMSCFLSQNIYSTLCINFVLHTGLTFINANKTHLKQTIVMAILSMPPFIACSDK